MPGWAACNPPALVEEMRGKHRNLKPQAEDDQEVPGPTVADRDIRGSSHCLWTGAIGVFQQIFEEKQSGLERRSNNLDNVCLSLRCVCMYLSVDHPSLRPLLLPIRIAIPISFLGVSFPPLFSGGHVPDVFPCDFCTLGCFAISPEASSQKGRSSKPHLKINLKIRIL